MADFKEPTIADRYLRSIGLAVGAVMVGVVAYPIVAVLAGFGVALNASDDEAATSSFGSYETADASDGDDFGSILLVLAGLVALLAVIAILTLAWLSLVALSRAGTEFKAHEALAARRSSGARRAVVTAVAKPMAPDSTVPAGERVVVLTESEKSQLDGIVPSSVEPGWYVDPLRQAGGRWWNGSGWTGRIQGVPR